MNWLRKLERTYIPNVRLTTSYRVIKVVILIVPLLFVGLLVQLVRLILPYVKRLKIKRQDKPDIVLYNILNGFANLISSSPEIDQMATRRAAICAKCPFAQKTGWYSFVVDNVTKTVQGYMCSVCTCNLSAKIRSVDDSCPKGYWK